MEAKEYKTTNIIKEWTAAIDSVIDILVPAVVVVVVIVIVSVAASDMKISKMKILALYNNQSSIFSKNTGKLKKT